MIKRLHLSGPLRRRAIRAKLYPAPKVVLPKVVLPKVVLFVATIVVTTVFTTGCLYRQDVQQGNEITWEMVDQLQPGMSKREVVRIIGYPLINDPFNRDRWDYFYSLKKGLSKTPEQYSVSLTFDGDALETIAPNLPERSTETGPEQDQPEQDTGGGY